DVGALAPDARYHVIARELLDFSIANRDALVVFLLRGEGTPHAAFAAELRDDLVDWALRYVAAAWPGVVVTPLVRATLQRVYAAFLESMATCLATYREEAVLREAVALFTAHHQGGLDHLFRTLALARSEGHEGDLHDRARA